MRNDSSKKERIISFILVLISIFVSNDYKGIYFPDYFLILFLVILGIVGMLSIFFFKGQHLLKEDLLYVILPIVCILISQIFNDDHSFGYEYKIGLLLFGIYIVKKVSFEYYIDAYIDIIYFTAIFSLVIWIGVMANIELWKMLPKSPNGSYYMAGLDVITTSLGNQHRNFGPFWEPGTYQIYLNIALIFLIFVKKKLDLKKISIIIITVISTYSTTGYICLVMIIAGYLISNIGKIKIHHVIIIAMVFTAILVVVNNEFILTVVFDKLLNKKKSSNSFMVRVDDFKTYLEIFLKNPLFGNGIIPAYEEATEKLNEMYGFTGTVSTTMREFASFGLLFGCIRLKMQLCFALRLTGKRWLSGGILFVIFLIFLNTEDLIYSTFMNTIFYYGVKNYGRGKQKNFISSNS